MQLASREILCKIYMTLPHRHVVMIRLHSTFDGFRACVRTNCVIILVGVSIHKISFECVQCNVIFIIIIIYTRLLAAVILIRVYKKSRYNLIRAE